MHTQYYQVWDDKQQMFTGSYAGCTPKQAASKAFTKYRQSNPQLQGSHIIKIRACSRNKNKKIFEYECEQVPLDQPQSLMLIGHQHPIIYHFRNSIKRIFAKPVKPEVVPPKPVLRGIWTIPTEPLVIEL